MSLWVEELLCYKNETYIISVSVDSLILFADILIVFENTIRMFTLIYDFYFMEVFRPFV